MMPGERNKEGEEWNGVPTPTEVMTVTAICWGKESKSPFMEYVLRTSSVPDTYNLDRLKVFVIYSKPHSGGEEMILQSN